MTVAAPRERVWGLMLDPEVMAGCVPGTQSVEVLSEVEYLAEIKVKISFISARFKIKTTIVESRAPDYLRIEGTGEDRSVASAVTQTSELFLTDLGDGTTELRIKVRADVMGRLGSFGLGIMKTKADRMWDEFGANFSAAATHSVEASAPAGPPEPGGRAEVAGGPVLAPVQDGPGATAEGPAGLPPGVAPPMPVRAGAAAVQPDGAQPPVPSKAGWWQRLTGRDGGGQGLPGLAVGLGERRLPTDIYMEFHSPDGLVRVLWPASASAEAARVLKELRRGP